MTTAAPATASRPDPVRSDRQGLGPLVVLHALFLAAGAVALSLDAPAQGWGVLACVTAYAVGLPLVCRATGRADLGALAGFLLLVSACQVLPDWVLVDLVGTLRFPDTGGLRVDDSIPLAMAGMWLAPLFVALALSGGRPGRAAVLAAAVFAGAEVLAPVLDLWEPVGDTVRVLGVAVYVVPAEAALGWAAATAVAHVRGRSLPVQAGAALAVSTFYLGALVLAHFALDVADWRLTA